MRSAAGVKPKQCFRCGVTGVFKNSAISCPDCFDIVRRLQIVSSGAIDRSTNPKCKAFPNYGGRLNPAIEEDFAQDRRNMTQYLFTLEGHDDPGLQLDRIDSLKGYLRGNLRFVTQHENLLNQRNPRLEKIIEDQKAEIAKLKQKIESLQK